VGTGGVGDQGEEQAVKAEQDCTDPAAAPTIIKDLYLAHGAVEAHPLVGDDVPGMGLRTIPVLSDIRAKKLRLSSSKPQKFLYAYLSLL